MILRYFIGPGKIRRCFVARGSFLAAFFLLLSPGFATSPVPSSKPSSFPSWWFERDVIRRTDSGNASPTWPTDYPASDDYAMLNQGQLKNFAAKAAEEMNAKLTGGTGVVLGDLVSSWTPSGPGGDDYGAVNQGQLKALAKLFYDRLIAQGQASAYPWTASTSDDDNYAAANIGHVKKLFAFEIATDSDTDGDGLSDIWELAHFENLDEDENGDPDSDGFSNFEEYLAGKDPLDDGDHPTETADTTGEVGLKIFTPLID